MDEHNDFEMWDANPLMLLNLVYICFFASSESQSMVVSCLLIQILTFIPYCMDRETDTFGSRDWYIVPHLIIMIFLVSLDIIYILSPSWDMLPFAFQLRSFSFHLLIRRWEQGQARTCSSLDQRWCEGWFEEKVWGSSYNATSGRHTYPHKH